VGYFEQLEVQLGSSIAGRYTQMNPRKSLMQRPWNDYLCLAVVMVVCCVYHCEQTIASGPSGTDCLGTDTAMNPPRWLSNLSRGTCQIGGRAKGARDQQWSESNRVLTI
jgi:hypothetical protein